MKLSVQHLWAYMCALTGGFTPYGSGGNVKLKYMDSPLGY